MVICVTFTFVSFDQPGPSPLSLSLATCFCLQNCCSLDVFLFFSLHSLKTLKTVGRERHRRSAVSEILKSPCLAPTIIPRSKSFGSNFFLEQRLNLFTISACFYAFSCCNMICINKLVYLKNCSSSVCIQKKIYIKNVLLDFVRNNHSCHIAFASQEANNSTNSVFTYIWNTVVSPTGLVLNESGWLFQPANMSWLILFPSRKIQQRSELFIDYGCRYSNVSTRLNDIVALDKSLC